MPLSMPCRRKPKMSLTRTQLRLLADYDPTEEPEALPYDRAFELPGGLAKLERDREHLIGNVIPFWLGRLLLLRHGSCRLS